MSFTDSLHRKVLFAVFDWAPFSLAAIAIKHEWRKGRVARGRCLFPARLFLVQNIGPECLARNKRRGSSIIHYHLPSIPYLGMLYDPRGIALPRNLSDGIGLRLDEGKEMRAVDYDVWQTFFPRYFIYRRLADVRYFEYFTSIVRYFASSLTWEIFKYMRTRCIYLCTYIRFLSFLSLILNKILK